MSLLIKTFSCLFLLVWVNNSFSQDRGRILIKADQLASEVLTPEKIYMYPEFSRGKIIFRDQTSTEALLNYNYANGEIEFIDLKKDTLAIAKNQMLNIKRVEVNKDSFYYDNGYLQQVLEIPLGKLAKREILIVLTKKKLGAYDQPVSTVGVEAMTTIRDYYGSNNGATLRIREDVLLEYKTQFFFGDNYYSFSPANKKNLLKIFRSKKEMINNYLQQNNVDFRNMEHLKKLFLFLQ